MLIAGLSAALTGCFVGDEEAGRWASREDIVAAAGRCGLPGFEPAEAGAGWAAYVPGEDPDRGPKGNCIYNDLRAHGVMATR